MPSQRTRPVHAALLRRLFTPVDSASLAAFRIMLGGLLVIEVGRRFLHGDIRRFYLDPAFHFTYPGFGWVHPWPGAWMFAHFAVLGLLALAGACGLYYRLAAVLLWLAYTYVFLLDPALYQNHYYLICLLTFLLCLVPAHRVASFDALRRTPQSETAPAWTLWILRAQIGLVYLYSGVMKLNGDWLRGEPLRHELSWRANPLLAVTDQFMPRDGLAYGLSYGGLVLDLLVVPLLLWRPTRAAALAAAIVFHLMNKALWDIGIFPWLMIAATLLFLPPDWPRQFRRLRPHRSGRAAGPLPARPSPPSLDGSWVVPALLAAYLAMQLLVPLRHYAYPGNASWTGEGDRFAWRMKLRYKTGWVRFFATDPVAGTSWEIHPSVYLSAWQISAMAHTPDLMWQFSQHLAHQWRQRTGRRIEVRVLARAMLNGRSAQWLIDPTVDLAAQPRTFWPPASWIVPLAEPLPGPRARTDPEALQRRAALEQRMHAWCQSQDRGPICDVLKDRPNDPAPASREPPPAPEKR